MNTFNEKNMEKNALSFETRACTKNSHFLNDTDLPKHVPRNPKNKSLTPPPQIYSMNENKSSKSSITKNDSARSKTLKTKNDEKYHDNISFFLIK